MADYENSFDTRYWNNVKKFNQSENYVPKEENNLEVVSENLIEYIPEVPGSNYIKPATAVVLLLLVAVSGNFTAELLGCQSQKYLGESMFAKHIVLIAIIYFTMDSNQLGVEPHMKFLYSLLMWVCFIFYTHLPIVHTILVTLCIVAVLVLNEYATVKKRKNKTFLLLLQKIIYTIIFVVTIHGFIAYYNKQSVDHNDVFSYITYILGKKQCDSINI